MDLNEGLSQLKFETYIEVIDRILEMQGFDELQRNAIFDFQENINILNDSFRKRLQPSKVFNLLNVEPAFELQESKKKPTTAKGKIKKFKKVMREFGKGKLKPYHADTPLKSKKQGGSKKEHKQALAISFSEAGLQRESYQGIYEDNESINLTLGQNFAVKFMKTVGLELISSPLQLKRGNLIFKDNINKDRRWMISNTGYIRTMDINTEASAYRFSNIPAEWRVLARLIPQQHIEKNNITDEEYIEAAHVLSEKVKKSRNSKNKFRQSYVNRAYKELNDTIIKLKTPQYSYHYVPEVKDSEIIEAIKKLYDKYVKK